MYRYNFFHPAIDDVREGIQEELEDTSEFFGCVMTERIQNGQIWVIGKELAPNFLTSPTQTCSLPNRIEVLPKEPAGLHCTVASENRHLIGHLP